MINSTMKTILLLAIVSVVSAQQGCVSDNAAVSESVLGKANGGECSDALEELVQYTVNCESSGDRSVDLGNIFGLLGAYSAICPPETTSPSFGTECLGLITCITGDNNVLDDCGADNSKLYSSLQCYIEFSLAGCSTARAVVKRLTKLATETCPPDCDSEVGSDQLLDLIELAGDGGLCDIAEALVLDFSTNCEPSGSIADDADAAFAAQGTFQESCSVATPSIEPDCDFYQKCYRLKAESDDVDCWAQRHSSCCIRRLEQRGCDLADRLQTYYQNSCPAPPTRRYPTAYSYKRGPYYGPIRRSTGRFNLRPPFRGAYYPHSYMHSSRRW